MFPKLGGMGKHREGRLQIVDPLLQVCRRTPGVIHRAKLVAYQ